MEADNLTLKLLIRDELTALIHQPFGKYIQRVLEKSIFPRTLSHFQLMFIEGGFYFVMIDWIKDNKDCSPEQIADLILDLIRY